MKYIKHIWIAVSVVFLASVANTAFSMIRAFKAVGQTEVPIDQLASAVSYSLYGHVVFVVTLALAIIATLVIVIRHKIRQGRQNNRNAI